MADLILNSVTYSGSPTNTANPQRPVDIDHDIIKIGRLIEAADGSTSWVHRAFKNKFTINWGSKANQTTRDAVAALYLLTTTFSITYTNGSTYTVLTVGEDTYTEKVTSDRANAYKYDLTITLREA